MSFKNPKAYETWTFFIRKKLKFSALDPAVTAVNLWVPPGKKQFILIAAYLRPTSLIPVGATDWPTKGTVKVDQYINSTTTVAVVAATTLAVADVPKTLALANAVVVTGATPLIVTTTQATGTAVATTTPIQSYDLIFTAVKLSD